MFSSFVPGTFLPANDLPISVSIFGGKFGTKRSVLGFWGSFLFLTVGLDLRTGSGAKNNNHFIISICDRSPPHEQKVQA